MSPTSLTSSLREPEGRTSPGGPGAPATASLRELAVTDALIAALPLPVPGTETLPPAARPATAPAGSRDRVTVTVRIDRAMHARLRALAARQRRTHQDILEGALDAYLNVFAPGCACNASAKPRLEPAR